MAQSTQEDAEVKKVRARIAVAGNRCEELEKLICRIYEDNILGKLPDSRYEVLDEISEVYDKYAARIIVDTVEECYVAMSVVGMLYQPLPNRTKDYIAMPKPNGYRSIHMTVYAYGLPFEVQIRTHAMHQAAEYGIVAHWKYKQGETSGNMDQINRLCF